MGWPGPVTHRQYAAWQQWLAEDMNRPSRETYHLMRIAQRIQQVLAKHPDKVRLEDQQVKFERRGAKKKKPPADPKQMAAVAKAKWLTAVGFTPAGTEAKRPTPRRRR